MNCPKSVVIVYRVAVGANRCLESHICEGKKGERFYFLCLLSFWLWWDGVTLGIHVNLEGLLSVKQFLGTRTPFLIHLSPSIYLFLTDVFYYYAIIVFHRRLLSHKYILTIYIIQYFTRYISTCFFFQWRNQSFLVLKQSSELFSVYTHRFK